MLQAELTEQQPHHIRWRKGLAIALAVLVIPALVVLSTVVWGERKYYLISILVLFFSIALFLLQFEHRKPQTREIVVLAVMVAIGVVGRAAFYMVPEFKPMVAITIITGMAFGGSSGFVTGAAIAFISNFFFGQGPWTPWQMLMTGLIGFLAGILLSGRRHPKWLVCLFGALSILLLYGPVLDLQAAFAMNSDITRAMVLTTYAAGLPYNLIHALGTAVFLFFLTDPLLRKLGRIQKKFGILQM